MADFRLPVHQHQVKVNGRDYLSDGRGMFVVTNAADIVEFQKLGAIRDGGDGSIPEWDSSGTSLVGLDGRRKVILPPANQSSYLPRFMAAVRNNNDATPTTFRVIGLGSSVGVGATLPVAATQSPVAKFSECLAEALNGLGNLDIETTNGSVNGTIITDGRDGDLADAIVTAGGNPHLVLLAYGMNDGMQAQYHAGQTFPGVRNALSGSGNPLSAGGLIGMIRAVGGDPILMTTPHPHTTRMDFTAWTTPISYPDTDTQIPGPTYAASVVDYDWLGSGTTVSASYRHLRVNQSIRDVAAEFGVALIDVEKYWFEAVAKYGEDALFDAGEYAHPNLLGHQESYWVAIRDFCNSLRAGRAYAPMPEKFGEILVTKPDNATRTTTDYANEDQLRFYLGAAETWRFEAHVFYGAPTGGDLKTRWDVPSGATGTVSVIGAGSDASTNLSHSACTQAGAITSAGGLYVGGTGATAGATFKGIVRGGGTAGYVTMQFGQVAASGTTTIYLDSWLYARQVA